MMQEDSATHAPNDNEVFIFSLYIVGTAPNSLRALVNLRAICTKYLPEQYQIQVIDILDDPLRALSDNVLLTPTLIKLAPLPETRIVGNLNDHLSVLLALGISERGDGR